LFSKHFLVSKAIDGMIIDHPDCLHERVADSWTDKGKPSFFEILAHDNRSLGLSGYLLRPPPVIDDGPVADKIPDITVKSTKFILYL